MSSIGASDSMSVPRPRNFLRDNLPLVMTVPALLVAAFFFTIPMAALFVNSFSVVNGLDVKWTLSNYTDIIGDSYYWEIMGRTLWIAVMATVVTMVLGFCAALYLYFSESKWRRVFLFLLVSPLFISVIVRTYGWIIILGPSGLLNWVIPGDARISLLKTDTGIIIALVHIYLPYMVLSLNASLIKMDRRLIHAATSLGARSWRIFKDVILPASLPGAIAGAIIVFSMSMTAFSTPVLIGGAVRKTMAYLVYQQNLLLGNWQFGSALAFVLLGVTVAIVTVLSRIGKRAEATR